MMTPSELQAIAEKEYPYPNIHEDYFVQSDLRDIDLQRDAFIKGLNNWNNQPSFKIKMKQIIDTIAKMELDENYNGHYHSGAAIMKDKIIELLEGLQYATPAAASIKNVKELPEVKVLDAAINNLVHGKPIEAKEIQRLFWIAIDRFKSIKP